MFEKMFDLRAHPVPVPGKNALKLLFEEGFEGAEDEIRKAYEKKRKGDNKNAILEAGKAFESTMKIICNKIKKDMSMIKQRILLKSLLLF